MIIMGDWNAVAREMKEQGISGTFGLGKRNQRGQRLIEFCKEQNLVITNTLFSQPKRRKYTWTMPEEGTRYQIDFILVRKRYRNQVKLSKSFPGTDIDSDYNLVIMESNLSLKKAANKQINRKRWYLDKLKDEEIR